MRRWSRVLQHILVQPPSSPHFFTPLSLASCNRVAHSSVANLLRARSAVQFAPYQLSDPGIARIRARNARRSSRGKGGKVLPPLVSLFFPPVGSRFFLSLGGGPPRLTFRPPFATLLGVAWDVYRWSSHLCPRRSRFIFCLARSRRCATYLR